MVLLGWCGYCTARMKVSEEPVTIRVPSGENVKQDPPTVPSPIVSSKVASGLIMLDSVQPIVECTPRVCVLRGLS